MKRAVRNFLIITTLGLAVVYFKIKKDIPVPLIKAEPGLPVVLVHGFNSDYTAWDKFLTHFNEEEKKNIFTVDLQPSYEGINTLTEKLIEQLTLVKSTTGKDKLILIAHSMGGVVVRNYINKFYQDDIDTFISICSPFKGAKIVDFFYDIKDWLINLLYKFKSFNWIMDTLEKLAIADTPAANQLNPKSEFIESLQIPLNPNIKYLTFSGNLFNLGLTQFDGVVFDNETTLPEVQNINFPLNHWDIVEEYITVRSIRMVLY